MKPFFTIHAGEYLTGEFIEQKLRDPNGNRLNLWVPAKDTGVDLLVTDHLNKNTILSPVTKGKMVVPMTP